MTILTQQSQKVNDLEAERQAKREARQATLIANLIELAEDSEKVKGFDTYQGQSLKFFNGRITSIEVTPEVYAGFTQELKEAGWQLTPQVTSGGYIAQRILSRKQTI